MAYLGGLQLPAMDKYSQPYSIRNARERAKQADRNLLITGISFVGLLLLMLLIWAVTPLPSDGFRSKSNAHYSTYLAPQAQYFVNAPSDYYGQKTGRVEYPGRRVEVNFDCCPDYPANSQLGQPFSTARADALHADTVVLKSGSISESSYTQLLPSPTLSIPEPSTADSPVRVFGVEGLPAQIQYPVCARELGLGAARVVVKVTVDASGNAIQTQVVGTANPCFIPEIRRAVKLLRFLPALYRGRPVAASIIIPIVFTP
jgi:hypothetical protein